MIIKKELKGCGLLFNLACALAGVDFLITLFLPNLTAMLSINKFGFFTIFLIDVYRNPSSYLELGKLHFGFLLIALSMIPFMVFVESGINFFSGWRSQFFGIGGIFSFFYYFYKNINSIEAARRLQLILFLTSVAVAFYVLCNYLGYLGDGRQYWQSGIQVNRSSGDFDPNIILLYMLPLFSFAPAILKTYNNKFSMVILVVIICVGVFSMLQLNSRTGTVSSMLALFISFILTSLISKHKKKITFNMFNILVPLVTFLVLFGLHLRYEIFSNILNIYEATSVITDRSFSVRISSYKFLLDEISRIPNLVGSTSGYSAYWKYLGFSYYPHCTLVDLYLKGGILTLIIYCSVILFIVKRCFTIFIDNKFWSFNVVMIGYLSYMLAWLPLMMTLSIDLYKMPWIIIATLFSLTTRHEFSGMR